ncbi:MAG: hypothetical protein QME51_07185 [Planctomycetota bacterium]|nr:hypothetical protein [Planctomycetota bacterium]
MTEKQVDIEFKRITKEVHSKPKCKTPYPYNIVKTRELLIIAQVLLSRVLDAKKVKDNLRESFLTKIYKLTLKQYFSCKRDYLLQY